MKTGRRTGPMMALLVSALMVVSLLGMFLVPMSAAAQAEPLEFSEGEGTAMGFRFNVGELFAEQESNITALIESLDNVTLNNLDLDGEIGAWALYEVTGVSDTEYTIEVKTGEILDLEASVSVTADMPVEGEVDIGDLIFGDGTMATESRTMGLDLDVKAGNVMTAEIVLRKTDLAVKSVDVSWDASMVATVDMDDFPMPTVASFEEENPTIEYVDWDVRADMVWSMDMQVAFSPALEVYQFPFDVSDSWTSYSNATVSGDIDGFLDVTGLPDDVQQEIFDSELFTDLNVTSFPVEFGELTIDDGEFQIDHGTIQTVTEAVEIDAYVYDSDTIVVGSENVDVYTIDMNDDDWFYVSDTIMLDSVDAMTQFIEDLDPEWSTMVETMAEMDMEMEVMTPAEGEEYIHEAEEFEANIAAEASGDEMSGDLLGFFLDPPYYGMIMIIVLIAVILVVYMVRRK